MDDKGRMPTVTPELAQAVTRLGHLRRQIRDLETEENLLREEILAVVERWPREAFPLRVGAFEVRLGERKGRIDAEASRQVLETEHLLAEIPRHPVIVDDEAVEGFGRALIRLDMPENTRQALVQAYQAAIQWPPNISHEALARFAEHARLTPDEYRACFKEGKPTVTTLTVR